MDCNLLEKEDGMKNRQLGGRVHVAAEALAIAATLILTLITPVPCHSLCGDGDSPPFSLDTSTGAIRAIVFDGCSGGLPVGMSGVTIEAMQDADVIASCITDGSAGCTLSDLPSGSYWVRGSMEGWETSSTTVEVFAGQTTDVSFDLHPLPDCLVILADDFNDGNDDGWTSWGLCSWEVTDGEYSASNTGERQWCVSWAGGTGWYDYAFEADVRGEAGVDKVLILRYQDPAHFYAINLRSDYPSPGMDEVTINRMYDGVFEADIVTVPYPSCNGVTYRLRGVVKRDSIKAYVDDVLVATWEDMSGDPLTQGAVGVACWTGDAQICDVSFDNALVSFLPVPPAVVSVANISTGEHLKITCTPELEPGCDSYRVYRGNAPGPPFDDYEWVGTIRYPETEFIDSELEEGETYYYAARSSVCPYLSDYTEVVSGVARYPVALVHGFRGDCVNWGSLNTWLQDLMGYADESVWICCNIDPLGSLENNGAALLDCINAGMQTVMESNDGFWPRKVNIIAHSMGGLIAREYMWGMNPNNSYLVDKVIMLGTPNTGAAFANACYYLPPWAAPPNVPGCPVGGDAGYDLLPRRVRDMIEVWGDSELGCDSESPEYYLIAGDARVWKERDPWVTVAEALGVSACGKYVVDGISHSDLYQTRSVFDDYINPILCGNAPPSTPTPNLVSRTDANPDVLSAASGAIETGEHLDASVWVDAGVDTLLVTALWADCDISFTCRKPSGALIDSAYAQQDPYVDHVRDVPDFGLRVEAYSVSSPESGEWTLVLDCADGDGSYAVETMGASLIAVEPGLPNNVGEPGSAVPLTLAVDESGIGVVGASCLAIVAGPVAPPDSVALHDDGAHGDGLDGDGVYGNECLVEHPGGHTVTFYAEGVAPSSGSFTRVSADGFHVGDATPPSVSVEFPDGGEELASGAACTLRWNAYDAGMVSSLDVIVSYDDGRTYTDTVAAFTYPESTCVWVTPSSYYAECRLAVLAYDEAGNCGSDVSDGAWSIVPSTGVPEDEGPVLSGLPRLFQNVPNPFNPVTSIAFEAPSGARSATLTICSLRGAVVRDWSWDSPTPGMHHVSWDSTDRRGRRAASGVYFYRLQVDEWSDLKKMVILK